MDGTANTNQTIANNVAAATAEPKTKYGNSDEPAGTVYEVKSSSHINKDRMSKSKYKKHIKKMNKQSITAIFNYSTLILTEPMTELLNLWLNFAILPLKLDLTQVLVDFTKYERSMVWKEFWYSKEDKSDNYKPPIFKENKTNFPKTTEFQRA